MSYGGKRIEFEAVMASGLGALGGLASYGVVMLAGVLWGGLRPLAPGVAMVVGCLVFLAVILVMALDDDEVNDGGVDTAQERQR